MTQTSCFRASFSKAARKTRTALAAAFLFMAGQSPFLHAAEALPPPPASEAAPVPVPVPVPQKKTFLQELYEANGGSYAEGRSGSELSNDELNKLFLQKFCNPAGTALPPEHANIALMAALAEIEKITGIGDQLVKSAKAGGVQFCDLQAMPTETAGHYMLQTNTVMTRAKKTPHALGMTAAHEILHAIQGQRGLLEYYHAWDLEKRVNRSLGIEAAAVTTEFLIAWQAAQQGDKSYWKSLQLSANFSYSDPEMYKTIENTWSESLLVGATPDVALRRAGTAAWKRVFSNNDFLNFYINQEVIRLLADLQDGKISPEEGLIKAGTGQDNRENFSGAISKTFNFTAGEKAPPFAGLLARNQKMKWAAEAVTILQYEKVFGKASPQALEQRKTAAGSGNPYLALDLEKIAVRVQSAPEKKSGSLSTYIYHLMDDALARQAEVNPETGIVPLPSLQPESPPAL